MTANEITELVIVSDAYSLELTEQMLAKQTNGCMAEDLSSQILRLIILKEQLLYKNQIEDYGDDTAKLYSCLLDAIADYSGASISADPNANIPNTIIDVTIIGDNRPSWFDFSWSEMESSDEVDGARYTYINPVLNGWNPSLQTGTQLLYRGVDYDMYEGGIIRLRTLGLYEGQSIRADNFQPFTAPPLTQIPGAGVILMFNNSDEDADYYDNFTGVQTISAGDEYEKDPIIDNQAFRIEAGLNSVFTYQRYNADGTPDGAPVDGGSFMTIENMSITKGHQFIITNA